MSTEHVKNRCPFFFDLITTRRHENILVFLPIITFRFVRHVAWRTAGKRIEKSQPIAYRGLNVMPAATPMTSPYFRFLGSDKPRAKWTNYSQILFSETSFFLATNKTGTKIITLYCQLMTIDEGQDHRQPSLCLTSTSTRCYRHGSFVTMLLTVEWRRGSFSHELWLVVTCCQGNHASYVISYTRDLSLA